MQILTSRDAQTNFGMLIDSAQKEPIKITRRNRPIAVVISNEEYDRLQHMEDVLWAEKAAKAMNSGIASDNDVKILFREIMNANS